MTVTATCGEIVARFYYAPILCGRNVPCPRHPRRELAPSTPKVPTASAENSAGNGEQVAE